MKLDVCFLQRSVLAALMMASLAACSVAPTPYQAAADDGGYSEQQIEDDRYNVKFTGNSATPREAVEEFALYRAAEITLQSGHDYFEVVSKEVEPVISSVSGVVPRIGIGLGGRNVGFGVSTGIGGDGSANYSYASYLDIVVYDGEKPEDNRNAYGAWDVIENLKSKIDPNAADPTHPDQSSKS